MKNINILFLTPYISKTVWGGRKLEEYGYECPYEKNGEAWLVSGIQNKNSKIKNLNNINLNDFYKNYSNFFNFYSKPFPLLVKIIDANDDLSVQVHPNDEYAKNKHNSYGKHECWYILDTNKNNSIIYGHNAKNKNELSNMIEKNLWDDLLVYQPITKDDFIDVEPGTVHAIKRGTLVYELQQSSDITYRLYDYNRAENGVKRELHLQDSINVINFNKNKDIKKINYEGVIVKNKFFVFEKIIINGKRIFCYKNAHWLQLTVISGTGFVNSFEIEKGTTFLVKYYTEFILDGNMELLVSYVPINI